MANPYESPRAKPASESANAFSKLVKSPVTWLVVSLASVVLVALFPQLLQDECWVGGFTLKVIVQPTTPLKKAPHFCLRHSREEVAAIMEEPEYLPGEFSQGKQVGKNEFAFHVLVSGRNSVWYRDTRSQAANWLVVHCETDDGETHRKVFAVPDGRKQRTIVVDIP